MSLSPDAIADRLEDYATRIRTGSIGRAIRLWTIWQTFNNANNPLRDDRLEPNTASLALNILASAALHETIMILVRAFDQNRRGRVLKTQRVSFPILAELANQPGVREVLERRAGSWFPDNWRAKENAQTVREALAEFQCGLHRLLSEKSNREERLRHFRDEFLAHNLSFDEDRERPVFRDIIDLLSEARQLSNKATIAFSGSTIEWEPLEKEAKRSSSELLNLIRRGVDADHHK